MQLFSRRAVRNLAAVSLSAVFAASAEAEAARAPSIGGNRAAQIFLHVMSDVRKNYINPNIQPEQMLKSGIDGLMAFTTGEIIKKAKADIAAMPGLMPDAADQALKAALEPQIPHLTALKDAMSAEGAATKTKFAAGIALEKAVLMVEERYPDLKFKERALIESGIEGMLSGLDPHSSFFDARQNQEFAIKQKGEFGGIGVGIATAEKGAFILAEPMTASPAEKSGLKQGDRIVAIDGKPVPATVEEVVDKIRGRPATTVMLELMREGVERPLFITLTREIIKQHALSGSKIGDRPGDSDIGYLKIDHFSDENLPYDLERKLTELDTTKGLIIDLRNNPGGRVDIVSYVAGRFLSSGEIVNTKGRHKSDEQKIKASPGPNDVTKPITILINGRSASASEIFAGAEQGNADAQGRQRATVLGTRSYGKGSVQTVKPFADIPGTQLHYTTGLYYTPRGSIQGLGVVPDILAEIPGITNEPHESDHKTMIPNPNGPDVVMANAPKESCALKKEFNMAALRKEFVLRMNDLAKTAVPDVQLLCAVATMNDRQSDFVEFKSYGGTITATPLAP